MPAVGRSEKTPKRISSFFFAEERIIGVEPFDHCVTKRQPAVLPLARQFLETVKSPSNPPYRQL